MSKFDELKKEAGIAIEQKWFNRLREEDAAAILELLAIQAQLVEALKDAIKELNAYSEADSGESFNNPAMNDALAAAGAQS